jgi:predicted nucleic acid-binding Zn ribbon protein
VGKAWEEHEFGFTCVVCGRPACFRDDETCSQECAAEYDRREEAEYQRRERAYERSYRGE